MSLFQLGDFKLASGQHANWKIECDALTDNDWACLAYLMFQRLPMFGKVEGVPTGGEKLAKAMQVYCAHGCDTFLLVDDVWTTGTSMTRWRMMNDIQGKLIGAVIFARGSVEHWVTPLFNMNFEVNG